MISALAEIWHSAFMKALQRHEASRPLKEAATTGRLGDWTQALTDVVVDTCEQLGWQTAAKWHKGNLLPVGRSEYLALDAVAFDARRPHGLPPWPFPVAVFELENSAEDDKVAYSLWKVLCVRTGLRVVFCYREDLAAGSALVRTLETAVVGSLPIEERVRLRGQTLLILGSRAEESTFPYGYFKDWMLDKNTGRFTRL